MCSQDDCVPRRHGGRACVAIFNCRGPPAPTQLAPQRGAVALCSCGGGDPPIHMLNYEKTLIAIRYTKHHLTHAR